MSHLNRFRRLNKQGILGGKKKNCICYVEGCKNFRYPRDRMCPSCEENLRDSIYKKLGGSQRKNRPNNYSSKRDGNATDQGKK